MDRPLHALKLRTRWVGHPLEYFPEIDSTNLHAQELARGGAREGTVVLADQQTAGRGRLGRSFFSPGGVSIYLSLVLRPQMPAERLHEHVFAAAVAVADTVALHVAPERLSIKWPNDVLIDGRKTSGINAPAQLNGDRAEFLVLGIGVNVNTPEEAFPRELRSTATSLQIALGRAVERTVFAEQLLEHLERELEDLRANGFASLLDRWRKYFRMRGARVRIEGRPEIREGIADEVDADGALIVLVPRSGESAGAGSGDGYARERVVAGDVALLEPVPPRSGREEN